MQIRFYLVLELTGLHVVYDAQEEPYAERGIVARHCKADLDEETLTGARHVIPYGSINARRFGQGHRYEGISDGLQDVDDAHDQQKPIVGLLQLDLAVGDHDVNDGRGGNY